MALVTTVNREWTKRRAFVTTAGMNTLVINAIPYVIPRFFSICKDIPKLSEQDIVIPAEESAKQEYGKVAYDQVQSEIDAQGEEFGVKLGLTGLALQSGVYATCLYFDVPEVFYIPAVTNTLSLLYERAG